MFEKHFVFRNFIYRFNVDDERSLSKTQYNFCVGMVLQFDEDLAMAYAEKQTRNSNTTSEKRVSTRNFVHGQSINGEEYHRVDGKFEEMGVDVIVHTQSGVIQAREDWKWYPTEVFNKKTNRVELRIGLEWIPNPIRPGTDKYKQLVASHPMGAKGWKPKIPQPFSVRFVDD